MSQSRARDQRVFLTSFTRDPKAPQLECRQGQKLCQDRVSSLGAESDETASTASSASVAAGRTDILGEGMVRFGGRNN